MAVGCQVMVASDRYHDTWRRASANWVAGLVVRQIIEMDEAREMMVELAVSLARRAYKLSKG